VSGQHLGLEGQAMKRLSICIVAFLVCNVVLGFTAMAARLLTSELVGQVLSVDQASFHREPWTTSQGQVTAWVEIAEFVAKIKVQDVVRTDHGLMPGAIIDVYYEIKMIGPKPLSNRPLKPGETVTLEVMGRMNGGYERR
jgi:hypothetical protein